MNRVDTPSRRHIVENDFVGANSDNGAVGFEKRLDSLALLQSQSVCREPEVGDCGIPGSRNRRERREEEVVDRLENDVDDREGSNRELNGGESEG